MVPDFLIHMFHECFTFSFHVHYSPIKGSVYSLSLSVNAHFNVTLKMNTTHTKNNTHIPQLESLSMFYRGLVAEYEAPIDCVRPIYVLQTFIV